MTYLLIRYLLKDTVNMKEEESLLISCNLSQRLEKGINKNHTQLAMIYFMQEELLAVLKKELLLIHQLINFIYTLLLLVLHLALQLVLMKEICKEEQSMPKNTLPIQKMMQLLLLHQLLLLTQNSVLKL